LNDSLEVFQWSEVAKQSFMKLQGLFYFAKIIFNFLTLKIIFLKKLKNCENA
jgi:hypothetical protein